jgi:hypothetical protein
MQINHYQDDELTALSIKELCDIQSSEDIGFNILMDLLNQYDSELEHVKSMDIINRSKTERDLTNRSDTADNTESD